MAQPEDHVRRTRAALGRLTTAFEEVVACLGEYASLGGSDGVKPFWETTDGAGQVVPRQLDITHQQFVDALATIQAFRDLADQGHATNLYRAKSQG